MEFFYHILCCPAINHGNTLEAQEDMYAHQKQSTLSHLLWENYKQWENNDPLASNEDGHYVGYKEQLFYEEQEIEHPADSHQNCERDNGLDPVSAVHGGIVKIAHQVYP